MKTKVLVSLFLTLALSVQGSNGSKDKEAGRSEISFTENKGQVCDQNYNSRPDVLFSGSANGINYHLTDKGVSYQLKRIDSWQKIEDKKTNSFSEMEKTSTIYRVDISWLGVNRNLTVTTDDQLPGVSNYYLHQCPNGATNVKSYGSIVYKNIYNGIDLKWYGKNNELEYDFIVHPNADYKLIRMEIKGAQNLSINKKGELEITTPLGTIIEKAPVAFQNKKQLKASWQLHKNTITIQVEDFDRTQTLIIDPVVRKWGTYYGVVNDDVGRDCESDASGNVYMAGDTGGGTSTLIATTGANQTVYNGGGNDGFIVKFNSLGVRQWGTYYGGTGLDYAMAIDIDGANEYVSGFTTSTGTVIATPGSHQANTGGGEEAFLVKFDQNGARIWGTFYGGTGNDRSYGCATDGTGNIYMCGYTNSSVLGDIATAGAHQTAYSAADDAFLVKFNSAGVRQWGTYYGGLGGENGYACATDGLGRVYLTGRTQTGTSGVISTAGSHQQFYSGGTNFDAFLVQFNSVGVRQWGTYCGAASAESGNACLGDVTGNVFLAGETASPTTTIIASAASHQTVFGGGTYDGFIVKFNGSGVRQWGTYYGGLGNDYGYGLAQDYYGNILMAGSSTSSGSISTIGSYQGALAGTTDGYLVNFNSSNGTRNWGTYYGGTGAEIARGCSTDNSGYIYLTGQSNSSNAIASVGAQQVLNSGLYDGFLAQFSDCSTTTVSISASSPSICSGQNATLTATGVGFTNYLWSTSSTNSVITVSPALTTVYSVTAGTGPQACNATSTFTLNVTTTPTVVVTPSTAINCIGSSTTIITASGASTYSWNTSATTNSIAVSPSVNTTYTVYGYNGSCVTTKTAFINAWATPTVMISGTSTQTYCTGGSVTLTAFGASTYTWSNGPTTFSNVVSPTVITVYTVTGSNGQCLDDYTVTVWPITQPTVNLSSSSSSICTGGTATLSASGAATFSWNTSATTSSIVVSPTIATNYTVTGYIGACVHTKTINLGISTTITLLAASSPSAICVGSSATLTANGASTYTWSTSSNSISIVVAPNSSTTYTVSGNSGSCFGTTTLNLSVYSLPIISAISNPSLICLSGTVALTAGGANSYTWMPGNLVGSTVTDTVSSTTIYTVTGLDAQSCTNSQTLQVVIDPCTSTAEFTDSPNAFRIYPNPSSGLFTIDSSLKGQYQLVDVLGKEILKIVLDSRSTQVKTEDMNCGVYFIVGNGLRQKVIINR